MQVDEAIDLIATLPSGSEYRRAALGYEELSDERESAFDIIDELRRFMTLYATGTTENASVTVRPERVMAEMARRERAKKASDVIRSTQWEEV